MGNNKILITSEEGLIDYVKYSIENDYYEYPKIYVNKINNYYYKDIDWYELQKYLTLITSTSHNSSS